MSGADHKTAPIKSLPLLSPFVDVFLCDDFAKRAFHAVRLHFVPLLELLATVLLLLAAIT